MRKSNTQKLSEVINEYLKGSKIDSKLRETRAKNAWPVVMGKSVAKHTRNIYIRKGVMYVHLDSSILRNELSYMRTRIRGAINEHAGGEVIKDLVLK